MLMLLFWVGNERWAIASADISDVLPLVNLQAMPCSHPVLAGLLNYRGEMIRTLDVSKVMTEQTAQPMMSTRIVVVEASDARLGLVVERAEEVVQLSELEALLGERTYLKATLRDEHGIVQQLALAPLFELAHGKAPAQAYGAAE